MDKFNRKLESLENTHKSFIEDHDINEYSLYELSRSLYNIAYDTDVFSQNGQIGIGYTKDNINKFKKDFNTFIEENNLSDELTYKQNIFDIIIQTYKSSATDEEWKANSCKCLKIKGGIAPILNWDNQQEIFNSIPENLIEELKMSLVVEK